MRISLSQTKFFDVGAFNGNVYVDKEDGKDFNALLVNCIESHYKTKLIGAVRMYFVLGGTGRFTIDEKDEPAELYDLFIINGGQIYSYKGKMKLLEVNVPATDSSNEEKI